MSFRKLNVDVSEDKFLEADYVPAEFQSKVSVDQVVEATIASTTKVRDLLQKYLKPINYRNNAAEALKVSLSDPPYGLDPDLEGAKKLALKAVLEVLNNTKSTDVSKHISNLSLTEKDTLMKYIFKGMSNPEAVNCGMLLSWHEKVVESAGLGCIMRVLTDHRTV